MLDIHLIVSKTLLGGVCKLPFLIPMISLLIFKFFLIFLRGLGLKVKVSKRIKIPLGRFKTEAFQIRQMILKILFYQFLRYKQKIRSNEQEKSLNENLFFFVGN